MTASTGGAGVFRWYTTPVGGVGAPTMIPATNVPGIRVYYVSVLNGICESDRTPVTVVTRKLPTIDGFTEKSPSACAAKDGSINFRVDSANSTYTVFFDKDGEAQTPVVFTSDPTGRFTLTGLGGGSYGAFYVVDKYGCKSLPFYGPVDLMDPVPAGPPIVNNGPLCVGAQLELTAPFLDGVTYKWTGPDGFSSTDQSPVIEEVTEASGGDYVLIVTKGSCVYRASRTTLEIAPTPKHQQFSPKALCEGTDLKVELLRDPGVSYAWTGHGVHQFDQDLLISPVSLAHSGYYLVTATSGVGCITLDSVEVRVDKQQTVSYGSDTAICSGDAAQLFVQTDGADVLWSPSGSLDDATALNPKASPVTKTEYQVVAHSGTTCPDITGKVTVDVIPAPAVTAYDTLVRMDVPYTIMPVYGQDAVKWHWVPADNLSCSDCPNPVFTSRNDMTYTVYVSNNLGCTSADTVTIRVFCDGASVTMPNAFTPNGDGKNDLYYVRGKGFAVKRFIIYNRLGQEVFHKENFLPNDKDYGWDGTLNGAQITEAAGFVYLLEVQCYGSTNEPMVMKGTVLLIR
jgi:gliding motility-associated-like protein